MEGLKRRILRGVPHLLALLLVSRFAVAQQVSTGAPSSQDSCQVYVNAFDTENHPLAGVHLEFRLNGRLLASADTDSTGHAALLRLPAGEAALTATKTGFLTHQQNNITLTEASPSNIELIMALQPAHAERVEVTATPDSVTPSAGTQSLPTESAKEVPSRPATVADALPLIPGVVRSPQGSLQISGSGEPRSGLIVNSVFICGPSVPGRRRPAARRHCPGSRGRGAG